MLEAGSVVLIDTTVIIAAHAYRIWVPLTEGFQLITVEKCIEEVRTGNLAGEHNIYIDPSEIGRRISVSKTDEMLMAAAVLQSNGSIHSLDDGEKELLSLSTSIEGAFSVSSQDKACVRVGFEMGFIDRFVSLEEMAVCVGQKASFDRHYTKKWLSELKTKIRMGVL